MSERAGTQPRVAVDVLQHNQRELLFTGAPERTPPLTPLTDGFADRRDLINWWQAACVRTFGHLAEWFPAKALFRDDALVAALVDDDTDGQAHVRQRLVERTLEATEQSYRDLEVRATEWLADADATSEDYTQIDPQTQEHIAMRPSFSRLDRSQAQALARLWDGFESRRELSRWFHALPSVADFGDVNAVEGSLPRQLAQDDHAREQLFAEGGGAAFRERFAAGVLLPGFCNRARSLRASERPQQRPDDNPWNEVR